ncbi:maleylpyruvate isomerase family mycothiol-dependent enzyme [Saccharopolyspora sp. ASAGF58]|uniref:maleylpyruvate isomerase family mycothiol-dependent enzyme n=1 Tax=Saccharopolyspora sp. ASAGF58 TaxID=2719023 RepID=UPI001FF0D0F1|nr:maleylpyruvate isomerase family mycothiol-dependent enzyme [Saccharopolyspora sp. ASAGF58]
MNHRPPDRAPGLERRQVAPRHRRSRRVRGRQRRDSEDIGVYAGAAEGVRTEPGKLLARWRAGRDRLPAALTAAPANGRLVWYGPPMTPASMATARITETWAHGHDVADALGVTREPTTAAAPRRTPGRANLRILLQHQRYSRPRRAAARRTPRAGKRRVGLGPGSRRRPSQRPALDFCLLVAQRRYRDDLAIGAVGDTARQSLTIAQAFAGAPGSGRAPIGS